MIHLLTYKELGYKPSIGKHRFSEILTILRDLYVNKYGKEYYSSVDFIAVTEGSAFYVLKSKWPTSLEYGSFMDELWDFLEEYLEEEI